MVGLFANLMRVTLTMSALAALILFCTPLLKKRYSASWRYWVWMVITVRLLIPFQMPAIELPDLSGPFQSAISAAWTAPQDSKTQISQEAEGQTRQDAPTLQEQSNQIEQQKTSESSSLAEKKAQTVQTEHLWSDWKTKLQTFPWKEAGVVIWGLGAVAVLAIRLVSYCRVRCVLRAYARPLQNPDCQTILEEIQNELGYHGPLRLMCCPAAASPMVSGLYRPLLLLPRQDYPIMTLKMIFRHELVHVMRHDLWYKLLLVAVSTVHWFNPIIHWMVRAADRDLEISCDERVTRQKDKAFRIQYSEAIFEVLQQGVGRRFLFTTGFCNEKKTLMQRFSAIFDTDRKPRGAVVMSVVLVACLLTGSLFGCRADSMQTASLPEELASSQLLTGSTGINVEEEALAQMDWTAQLYETYRFGHDLAESEAPEGVAGLGYGYLKEKGLLDPYLDASGWAYDIPFDRLAEIQDFFMVSPVSRPDDAGWLNRYSTDYAEDDRFAFSLEKSGVKQKENGDIIIDYRRLAGESHLRPVRYVFRPVTVQKVPEALKEDFSEGDVVYQIVGVTNLDMEQQPGRQTIEISNVQELLEAAERINAGGWLNQYDTYLLTADIDLSGVVFTPMGQNERYLGHWDDDDARDPTLRGFNGVFDGQGHTISGLRLEASEQDYLADPDYAPDGIGLFSLIGSDGVVKNLNLKECIVTSPCQYGSEYGAAGLLAGTCNGTLESVSVEGTVEGGYEVGGIAGQIGGSASHCKASVTVSGFGEVGAFAGSFCYGELEDCTASGQVLSIQAQDVNNQEAPPKSIGGFIGFSVQGTVIDCEASVYVSTTVSSNWVGAFAGYVQSFRAESCVYDAQKASGWKTVGVVYNTSADDQQDIQAA